MKASGFTLNDTNSPKNTWCKGLYSILPVALATAQHSYRKTTVSPVGSVSISAMLRLNMRNSDTEIAGYRIFAQMHCNFRLISNSRTLSPSKQLSTSTIPMLFFGTLYGYWRQVVA